MEASRGATMGARLIHREPLAMPARAAPVIVTLDVGNPQFATQPTSDDVTPPISNGAPEHGGAPRPF